MKKNELLLPAGSIETFYAALNGGADAVYLGLRQFNARERARNFTLKQLKAVTNIAHQKKVKVYLTLNTLLKNSELPELLELLNNLKNSGIDALIIQDLGVYYLIRKHFDYFKLHASTQMGNHNSLGTEFSEQLGFERVILARELTFDELNRIGKKTNIDLEIFIHGALCYSFSGMCLFSSYLGGMSANRGSCRQPCRRIYKVDEESFYAFNLKDNQQADRLKKLVKSGIASFKIEGRMKSDEYVYQTAKAYRLLLDFPYKLTQARELLSNDLGREKTGYFLSNDVSDAISDSPYNGQKAGTVIEGKPQLKVKLELPLETNYRLRIMGLDGFQAKAFRLKKMLLNGRLTDSASSGDTVILPDVSTAYSAGDRLYIQSRENLHFPTQFPELPFYKERPFPGKKKMSILNGITPSNPASRREVFVRINSLKWLRKLYLKHFDKLIVNFTLAELPEYYLQSEFWQKNLNRIIIQLPRFIPEKEINGWNKQINRLTELGVSNFMLSHLSQKLFFDKHKKIKLYTSENVYVLNDASIALLKEQGIYNWVFPLENDFPNLIKGNDRRGIVPLFFYPELFFSRMPVKIKEDHVFSDNRQNYILKRKAGMTIIIPEYPVSLLQFHKRLYEKGFRRFLLDLSWLKSSTGRFNRLMKLFRDSQPEQPASIFNFKAGLK